MSGRLPRLRATDWPIGPHKLAVLPVASDHGLLRRDDRTWLDSVCFLLTRG